MSLTISKHCASITPSVTLSINSKSNEMREKGIDVISFGAGEPDFCTPEYICNAAIEAIRHGKTKYTASSGTVKLRKAIADKLLRDNGLSYGADEIIVSNGAKQSLYIALQAMLDPGDEVLIPSPCWVSYPEMVRMCSGVPVYIRTSEERGFIPSAEDIEKMITPKTKVFILTSPSNPNGVVYDYEHMKAIAELAVKHQFYILSDEIYEKLIYDGKKHISIASISEEVKKQTIVVNGMSKAYAMTGWRIGYAAGPKDVIKAMGSYQSHATSNANSIAQEAATEALSREDDDMKKMVDEFEARRDLAYNMINAIPDMRCVRPEGAFYIMCNISKFLGKSYNGKKLSTSVELCSALLENFHVAVVPGEAFEAPNYFRISYAISRSQIKTGLERIAAFVSALQ
ncbi:MAG: pyridoxal phosphate-dependent aminotransferase [Eubacteriales bacterium]|nr:pyridoxal phosphate-dependent aminotransferase [Eubacteriales bacterium]MDD3882750.1 pyridoxal phosphate-dependent aminotransferase [Eubacteriales bacterium]MDD4512629.1 pyridoxal phosphate-dependent aminotransferase [Eubacteriales bacterium]